MVMAKINSLICICLLLAIGCTTGKCRQKKDNKSFVEHINDIPEFESKSPTIIESKDLEQIRVFKPDGSRQCESRSSVSVDVFKKELEDSKIRVFRVSHQSDGAMYMQVCGAPTGMIYIFDIQRLDLKKAKDMGYRLWQEP